MSASAISSTNPSENFLIRDLVDLYEKYIVLTGRQILERRTLGPVPLTAEKVDRHANSILSLKKELAPKLRTYLKEVLAQKIFPSSKKVQEHFIKELEAFKSLQTTLESPAVPSDPSLKKPPEEAS